jgi:hypothetical protein
VGPCPYGIRDKVNTKIEARWGEMKCVDEIVYSDVDGVFTYGVEFEKGVIVCGRHIRGPRAMKEDTLGMERNTIAVVHLITWVR